MLRNKLNRSKLARLLKIIKHIVWFLNSLDWLVKKIFINYSRWLLNSLVNKYKLICSIVLIDVMRMDFVLMANVTAGKAFMDKVVKSMILLCLIMAMITHKL